MENISSKISPIVRVAVLTLFVWCLSSSSIKAQGDWLFVIKGYDTVYPKDFMNSFNKNNNSSNLSDALNEYLGLYVNYRLKLLDAHSIGLESDSNIVKQVSEYRSSLIKPLINDPKILDSLARQAYERQKILLHARHILISMPRNVSIQDTLTYYNKAMNVYERLKKGEDFTRLADLYSDDPSGKSSSKYPSGGDLGYFTSMTMIFPFEEACYNAYNKGERFAFVKTDFGYHIIEILGALKTDKLAYDFKHIYINTLEHSDKDAQDLINKAFNEIEKLGFDSVAKLYSEDKYSKDNGGLIAKQRPSSVPSQYIDSVSIMTKGMISHPFKTRFGWHIIQYVDDMPLPDFNSQKTSILNRISKDSRAYISVDRFIDNAIQDYGMAVDSMELREVDGQLSDSIFSASWQIGEGEHDNTLFSVGDSIYAVQSFLEYIYEHQTKQVPMDISMYVDKMFETYSRTEVLNYAESHLEDKYPELKETIVDYTNGELIFAITNQRVWNKSLQDTVGLKEYYEKNKSKYMYSTRVDADIWYIDPHINFSKAQKNLLKYKKKGKTNDEIRAILNDKLVSDSDTIDGRKARRINYSWNRFEEGNNSTIDKNIFDGNGNINANVMEKMNKKNKKDIFILLDTTSIVNRNIVICINEVLPVSEKPLSACKGLCTSDYQDYLEKNWIEELKSRYNVEINYAEFKKLKSNNGNK